MKSLLCTLSFILLTCACTTRPAVTPEPTPVPECLPDGSCCGEAIAARVGEAVLTEKALAETLERMVAYHDATAEEDAELLDEERVYLPTMFRTGALVEFATRALVRAIAERNGITVTPEEVAKSRAEYDAYLAEIEEEGTPSTPELPEAFTPDFEVALLTEKIAEFCTREMEPISDEEVHAALAQRTLDIAALKAEFDYYRGAVASGCVDFESLIAAIDGDTTPTVIPNNELEAVLPPELIDDFLTTPEGELTEVLIEDGSIALVKILKRAPAQADTGAQTEFLLLAKPIPVGVTFDEVRDELESQRLEAAYLAFTAEQIRAIGVRFPSDPELEATFTQGFSFP